MKLPPALAFFAGHAALLALMLVVVVSAGTALAGRRMSLAIRSALGLAVIGQTLVLLGVAGLLRAWSICLLIAGSLLLGAIRQGGISWKTTHWKWVALLSAVAVPMFVLALHPPLAFDETLYHLPIVRATARAGRILFLSDLRFPVFAQLHEMLCVPPFLAMDDVATHLVALIEALILAAVLVEWPQSQRRAGLLAAALFLGNPIVVQQATTDSVDLALTLFVGAGFFCLDRTTEPENGRWYALAAGFLLGTACSVKYLGWYFAFAALAWLILSTSRRRTAPLFFAALLVGVLPMYGQILGLTGNPVFPFLPQLFGKTPWTMPLSEMISGVTRVANALRLPWDVTFARERLNRQPPYSPLFAIALLVTLAASIRNQRALMISLLCAGYFAVFTFLPQDSRYLLPLLPLLAVVAAMEVEPWLRNRAQATFILLTLVVIAPAPAYAIYRLARQGLPPVTAARRQQYLEEKIPEFRALQKRGAGRIYVCGAEQLKYFGGNDLLGDLTGPFASETILDENRDSAALWQSLTRIGVRYLLMSRRACRPEWQRVPAVPEFELMYADGGATLWRVKAGPMWPSIPMLGQSLERSKRRRAGPP